MGRNPRHSRAIAYLRQLCCSGLDKEIVIPEFLRAVQSVVPSSNNTFTGLDGRYMPSYFMLGFAAAATDGLTPVVISSFFTPELRSRIAVWFSLHSVLTEGTVLDESFYLPDRYSLVYRSFDRHHSLHASVVQYGKPVGMLNLFRPRNQQPFNCHEQALLTCLLPYVGHALRGGG